MMKVIAVKISMTKLIVVKLNLVNHKPKKQKQEVIIVRLIPMRMLLQLVQIKKMKR